MNEFKTSDVVYHPEHGRGIVQGGEWGSMWVQFAGHETPVTAVADDLRLLAVIDPLDRKQVERLAKEHQSAAGFTRWDVLHPNTRQDLTDVMKTALREFAAPTPPKCGAHINLAGAGFQCVESAEHGGPHRNPDAQAVWGDGA